MTCPPSRPLTPAPTSNARPDRAPPPHRDRTPWRGETIANHEPGRIRDPLRQRSGIQRRVHTESGQYEDLQRGGDAAAAVAGHRRIRVERFGVAVPIGQSCVLAQRALGGEIVEHRSACGAGDVADRAGAAQIVGRRPRVEQVPRRASAVTSSTSTVGSAPGRAVISPSPGRLSPALSVPPPATQAASPPSVARTSDRPAQRRTHQIGCQCSGNLTNS